MAALTVAQLSAAASTVGGFSFPTSFGLIGFLNYFIYPQPVCLHRFAQLLRLAFKPVRCPATKEPICRPTA